MRSTSKDRLRFLIQNWWRRFTTPHATDDIEARLEYMTRVIILVMIIVLYLFTLVIIIGSFFIPWGSEAIPIMLILDFGAAISLWTTQRGGWRINKFIPPLVFFFMGLAGAYLYGLMNTLVLFYALSVIIASLLLGVKYQWPFLILSVIAHLVVGQTFHPQAISDYVPVGITLMGSLSGIAFLVSFAMRQMDRTLLEVGAANQRMLIEVEERRRAEEEKFRFAQNYALALQNSQKFFFYLRKLPNDDIIAILDEKRIPKQFGFGVQNKNGKTIAEIWDQETENKVLPDILRAFNGEVINFEVEINQVCCYFVLTPVYIQGVINEISGMCTDITEQKRAQIALKESEERLRRITDNMLDMVIQTDTHLNYIYISPSVEGILGYKPEDLLGKSIYFLVHPEDRLRELSTKQLLVELKTPTRSVARYKHAQGHYLWLEMIGKPLFSPQGKFSGIIQGARDISENRRTEEALLASEQRFRSVFDNASVGIALVDRQDYIHAANSAYCEFLGYSQEELTGKQINDFIIPDDINIDDKLFADLEAGKREFYTIDKRHIHKSGKHIWGRLSVSGLRELNNSVSFTVVICENITETKRREILARTGGF